MIYKEEAYNIIGICMDIYNTLGYGFAEVVYKDAMEIEFIEDNIEYCREKEYAVFYKGKKLQRTFKTDFTLYDGIIVEVKAHAEGILDEDMAQTINYLKVSGNELGLLINFSKKKLEYKRVVF